MAVKVEYTKSAKRALNNGAELSDMYTHIDILWGGDAMHRKEYAGLMPTDWLKEVGGDNEFPEQIACHLTDTLYASGLIVVAVSGEDLLQHELSFIEPGEPINRPIETIMRDALGLDLDSELIGHAHKPSPNVIYATQGALGDDADEYDAIALHVAAYKASEGYGYHRGTTDVVALYDQLNCKGFAAELREEANNC